MFVFPGIVPSLAIVETADEIIAEGEPDPVTILLPFGSTTSRTITVQGHDFAGIVLIDVVLTPQSGDQLLYPAEIDRVKAASPKLL